MLQSLAEAQHVRGFIVLTQEPLGVLVARDDGPNATDPPGDGGAASSVGSGGSSPGSSHGGAGGGSYQWISQYLRRLLRHAHANYVLLEDYSLAEVPAAAAATP